MRSVSLSGVVDYAAQTAGGQMKGDDVLGISSPEHPIMKRQYGNRVKGPSISERMGSESSLKVRTLPVFFE